MTIMSVRPAKCTRSQGVKLTKQNVSVFHQLLVVFSHQIRHD